MRWLILCVIFICYTANSVAQYKTLIFDKPPLPYLGYVPENYNDTDGKWPLILFLHGLGEKGDGSTEELEKVKRWGPPQLAEEGEMPPGFIIIAPQLPKGESAWKPSLVDEVLNFTLEKYKVEKTRIYLTGLSLGGNGTYRYAYSEYNEPNQLAAIVAVAAWGDPAKACTLVEDGIAVWAFHGDQDNTVEYERGLEMFNALKGCGKDLAPSDYRFTTYEDVGHNSWSRAFAAQAPELSVYEWLSFHSLQTSESGSGNAKLHLEEISELPVSLHEASGLTSGKNGDLWIHNDSGNEPFLIRLNQKGEITGHTKVVYASNFDWEDIASDSDGNLYVADIGNNENLRKELFIYKIDPSQEKDNRVEAKTIRFSYPEQASFPPAPSKMMYDAETLIHYKGDLFIFTKNRTVPYTGYTYIYKVPDEPGTYEAQFVDSLNLGGTNMIQGWITGGDISPDQKRIVLLGHDKLYVLSCFENGFSSSKIRTFNLDSFTQKEGIGFTDNNTLFIVDETFQNLLKGKLYRLSLPPSANSTCD